MRQSQQINSTVVRDIVNICEDGSSIGDVINAVGAGVDASSKWLSAGRHTTGSISRRASDLVLVFPVLISTSLKWDTAMLLSKAIERKCVSLLQILFSATNMTNYKDTKDLYDYVGKFHKNLKVGSAVSLDDFISAMNQGVAEGAFEVINKDEYDAVMESLRGINEAANNILRQSSVDDYNVTNTLYGNVNVTLEDSANDNKPKSGRYDYGTTEIGNQEGQWRKDQFRANDDQKFFSAQILSQKDLEKANELQPTMMVVNFISMAGNNDVHRHGIIGVKAKMYPVESMDLIRRLTNKYSDNNTLFNLIRCSTKERSFFRDFLFALDKTKFDAVNVAKDSVNSRLFKVLERRANNSKFASLLRRNDASPITTLVMSQEEVEYMRKYSNIDLERANVCKVLLNGFNLLSVVLVDDSIEVARFLFDGDDAFETITYQALSREQKDGDYKKIVNLMDKVAR